MTSHARVRASRQLSAQFSAEGIANNEALIGTCWRRHPEDPQGVQGIRNAPDRWPKRMRSQRSTPVPAPCQHKTNHSHNVMSRNDNTLLHVNVPVL